MNIYQLQAELRKCCVYPYCWGKRQDDATDKATRFVYDEPTFLEANRRILTLPVEQQNYARARWLNFWSAQGVEAIFGAHDRVKPNPERKHRTIDFWIDDIPFDHKTTVFPRAFPGGITAATADPSTMIDWLYANQSTGQRHHTANRLFLVLHASDGRHWRLKTELCAIRDEVNHYLDYFEPVFLHHTANGSQADCIWYIQAKVGSL